MTQVELGDSLWQSYSVVVGIAVAVDERMISAMAEQFHRIHSVNCDHRDHQSNNKRETRIWDHMSHYSWDDVHCIRHFVS